MGLAANTVCAYSHRKHPEAPMYPHLRQHYRPRPDRMPGWLRKLWVWF